MAMLVYQRVVSRMVVSYMFMHACHAYELIHLHGATSSLFGV